jgi:excisionase family DNA binding protein
MMADVAFYTVKDIADMFQVAETTVRHWIRTGELPAIAIGKGWRVTREGLDRFLETRKTNTDDDKEAAATED